MSSLRMSESVICRFHMEALLLILTIANTISLSFIPNPNPLIVEEKELPKN